MLDKNLQEQSVRCKVGTLLRREREEGEDVGTCKRGVLGDAMGIV